MNSFEYELLKANSFGLFSNGFDTSIKVNDTIKNAITNINDTMIFLLNVHFFEFKSKDVIDKSSL
ncbi:hypothetical protein NUITMVP1_31640 [Proteus mirabilis]|nr:hypothetical protein NUITMVP1_31640 [Proteus mirabilis]